jgi:hypothetical protein
MDTQTYERIEAYLGKSRETLRLLKAMWEDPMVQLYNDAELPDDLSSTPSVFLAGPTSRHQVLECHWRGSAVNYLRRFGFTGYIFCPEPRGLEKAEDFTERSYIHRWESGRLMKAKYKAFWIPRKADELLGLNSNFETALFVGMAIAGAQLENENISFDTSRLLIGWPDTAERMGLPNHYTTEWAKLTPYSSLMTLCGDIATKN